MNAHDMRDRGSKPAAGRIEWRLARWAAVVVAVAVALVIGSGTAAAGTGWKWHDAFAFGAERPVVGDFNGDGKDDIATFQCGDRATGGDVFVALSTGTMFQGTGVKWHDAFCFGNEIPLAGDFDGDGDDDIVTFQCGQSGDVFVALSDRRSFQGTGLKWHDAFCFGNDVPMVGDFNGDGRDDVVVFQRGDRTTGGGVFVALSDGRAFEGTGVKWHSAFAYGAEKPAVGDFDGDGDDDIVTFQCGNRPDGGDVYVALSDRRSFQGTGLKWHDAFCFDNEKPAVGDFFDGDPGTDANRPYNFHNGDRKDDLVTFQCGQSGDVFVAHSTGRAFEGVGSRWHESFCFGDEIPLVGDFDGDGKDDIVSFTRGDRPYSGNVFVAFSLAWSPNFQNDRRFFQAFTQLKPSDCTRFIREWSRRLSLDDAWRMGNCERIMGLKQYCDGQKNADGMAGTLVVGFTTDAPLRRYLICQLPSEELSVLQQTGRIAEGVIDGVIAALVFAVTYGDTVVSGIACTKGVIFACVSLALDLLEYAGLRLIPELRVAVALADRVATCVNGNIAACAQFGLEGARTAGVAIPGLDADAVANAQACAGGEFAACVRLGLAAAEAGGIPVGLGPQEIADVQDCLDGISEACRALGFSAAQAAAQATGFPLNGVLQGAANADLCSRGDTNACIRLGKGMVGSSVAQDAQAVAQCGAGDTNACIRLAKQLVGSRLGQGVEDAEKCAQDDTAACIALGRSLVALVRS